MAKLLVLAALGSAMVETPVYAQEAPPPWKPIVTKCKSFEIIKEEKLSRNPKRASIFLAFRGLLVGGTKRYTQTCEWQFPIGEMPPPYNTWHYAGGFHADDSTLVKRPKSPYYARCFNMKIAYLTRDTVVIHADIRNEWTRKTVVCQFRGWIDVEAPRQDD